jgi:hypothetical protein
MAECLYKINIDFVGMPVPPIGGEATAAKLFQLVLKAGIEILPSRR